MSTISFADIVKDRDSSVRVTVDGMIYAVDLVMVMTGKNRDDSGKVLRNLTDEIFSSAKFTEKNTGGSGGSRTKLVSFKDALELVMVLPGKVAKEIRTQFAGIIQRYMAGHVSVAMEVEANAQSDAPIAQMARASLAAEYAPAELVQDAYALERKRKLQSLEIERMELDINIKKQKSELELTIRRREAEFEYATKITTTYRDLCQDTLMDTRARMMFKDYYLNMIMPSQAASAPQVTDGSTGVASLSVMNKPVSLSQVATRMGLKIPTGDLKSLGVKLRKLYETKHGQPPGKHDQLCDGRMTQVNSYMESDCPLIEEVLNEWQSLCDS